MGETICSLPWFSHDSRRTHQIENDSAVGVSLQNGLWAYDQPLDQPLLLEVPSTSSTRSQVPDGEV